MSRERPSYPLQDGYRAKEHISPSLGRGGKGEYQAKNLSATASGSTLSRCTLYSPFGRNPFTCNVSPNFAA
jgi:hypothetical protein